MQVKVLNDFDYAHDGTTAKHLKKGDTPHIHDRFVPGLKAAGFVGDLGKADKPTPAPEEPAAEAAAEAEPAPAEEADAADAKAPAKAAKA